MLKVFLAEDEVIVREALRDSIPWEEHGFRFAGEASDGEMALELVRTLRPDIVITDIKMPFMDGLTFSRIVSEEMPATKIIIISGYDEFEYARRAVELHADQFLLKPVTKTELIRALEKTRERIEQERKQSEVLLKYMQSDNETEKFSDLDLTSVDPSLINTFLATGREEETEDFVSGFLHSLNGAEQSVLFCNYLAVNTRLGAERIAQKAGIEADRIRDLFPDIRLSFSPEELKNYLCTVLKTAVSLRGGTQKSGGDIVEDAMKYIDANFSDETISLNTVARAINVSPNYLSAVFSQRAGEPLIEYLTEKRMERAKQLLRETSRRSGEIAIEVGYKDPRYFSFVFKKTQGCTPSEYRAGEAGKHADLHGK